MEAWASQIVGGTIQQKALLVNEFNSTGALEYVYSG
jgi:hypothetical protein